MRAVFADCHVGRRPDDEGPFLEALEEAAGRGARAISLLRDFFLRGSYVEGLFARICDEETFEQGGRRFLLTHGDLLNEADIPYRFWRFLSKNPVSRAALAFIPREAGNRFVWKVEARLYRSNFKHKSRLPFE